MERRTTTRKRERVIDRVKATRDQVTKALGIADRDEEDEDHDCDNDDTDNEDDEWDNGDSLFCRAS